jgi:hypothetical protein
MEVSHSSKAAKTKLVRKQTLISLLPGDAGVRESVSKRPLSAAQTAPYLPATSTAARSRPRRYGVAINHLL